MFFSETVSCLYNGNGEEYCTPAVLGKSMMDFWSPRLTIGMSSPTTDTEPYLFISFIHALLRDQMVQQRKQEEEEERQRQQSHALERAERAKLKQASLTKLQESWTTQSHTTLSKAGGAKRGRGGQQGSDQAPQYESGSEDDADILSENEEDEAGQGDRYGDGVGTSDAQTPLGPANLKDIGLSSSSDDSDDAFGGDEDRESAGQKRKWDSDEDDGQAAGDGSSSSKRRTVGDSD